MTRNQAPGHRRGRPWGRTSENPSPLPGGHSRRRGRSRYRDRSAGTRSCPGRRQRRRFAVRARTRAARPCSACNDRDGKRRPSRASRHRSASRSWSSDSFSNLGNDLAPRFKGAGGLRLFRNRGIDPRGHVLDRLQHIQFQVQALSLLRERPGVKTVPQVVLSRPC